MMKLSERSMVFIILAMLMVSILCHAGRVGAIRVLPEAGDKFFLARWLQRLDSGPSPSGPDMNSAKITSLLIIFVLAVAVLNLVGSAEAGRVLSEDFGGENHLEKYPSVYENAKQSLTFWLQRLSSGPSPSGPGH
ncbi:hypothetical protein L484_018125 [Morus notabilis]|uniref:Uncharacterized protein n=1 Tax=Morus notabilis TaxID=981085 RepID=W9R3D2_9ROSA|nr:hypothetical protein L484_018125 [Morus notabilis]